MKTNDWKYLIDALLFVAICSLGASGLLLAFVIPSGKVPNVSKYYLGIHRHAWGDIHFYVAISVLSLLVLHLWLNWAWVCHWSKSYFGVHWKQVLWGMSGGWLVVLLVGWVLVKS